MATVKVTLDKRASNTTVDGMHPMVLRIGHKSKTRDIPFHIHVHADQYDPNTGEITGIRNAVRNTKRVRKIFSDVDLWVDDNQGLIKNWEIDFLKQKIEKRFFNKQESRTILTWGAVYLDRLKKEKRYGTADSYEDALKALVKYRKKLKKKDDKASIKTLFETKNDKLTVKDDYTVYDMEIKAMDYGFMTQFKAYMTDRFPSRNTPAMHLRSLQAIMNDAGNAFEELENHKPLSKIKKQSSANPPNPLTLDELNRIRLIDLKSGTAIWHYRNYLLFMFNNMGMNHFDIAILKRSQFKEGRIKYFRKKTIEEGDYFSVLQNDEALEILSHYLNGQHPDDYLFPIMPRDTPEHRLHIVNNDKVKTFNKYANRMAKMAGIDKKITTYSVRDTWTNIGLDLGIDIRQISTGLGHSSVQVTEKHYGQSVTEKVLDAVNKKITDRVRKSA
ncbi:MAG: tyrosine-type recombinase/integrase [Owenweeksia sp.]